MKHYLSIFFAVIIAVFFSLNTNRMFGFDELAVFLTVIGLIYGLMAAFTINNSWERFSKIRDNIAIETNSLLTMCIFARKFSDKKIYAQLKNKIIDYCQEIPVIEWKDYWKSEKAHKKFLDITEIISEIKPKNEFEIELFNQAAEELREASKARTEQLVLSQSRISKIQWTLTVFLSAVLVIGLSVIKYSSLKTTMFVSIPMIAAVLMIFIVIYELDSLKVSEEEISIDPYRKVIREINQLKN